MLNPWAVVSLLSWSGGNRWGWGIAGWKMFENVWFQAVLAQCLGHLEITWDEYLEWLHHWKIASWINAALRSWSCLSTWTKHLMKQTSANLRIENVVVRNRGTSRTPRARITEMNQTTTISSRNLLEQKYVCTTSISNKAPSPNRCLARQFHGFLWLFDAFWCFLFQNDRMCFLLWLHETWMLECEKLEARGCTKVHMTDGLWYS